jgi:hypothetical protein
MRVDPACQVPLWDGPDSSFATQVPASETTGLTVPVKTIVEQLGPGNLSHSGYSPAPGSGDSR